MLCLSVGIAVFFLMAFHIFLAATSQTTIEFHGNIHKWRKSRHRGVLWSNPYDLGWKRNLKQVYGPNLSLLSLLPSTREPEYLPLPLPGERGLRPNTGGKKYEGKSALHLPTGCATDNPSRTDKKSDPFRESGTEDEQPLLQRGNRGVGAAVAPPALIEV
jgi:hypothetical protein